MGIVNISDAMHQEVRRASQALTRSINAQAEHWMKIGMLAELNPELCYADICRLLMNSPTLPLSELADVRHSN
ncbi:ParD-like family protein [Pokkaliibacter sp. MBI-7]|uniref:ParD-like family protein n=1 Tax=Proteobacteria bacterium 228 TaxID=2083153 RepID=A0A2S5KKS2_9PROT|nr:MULTISPECIES: ParD-like family protein [Pokkaliibacter]MDH2432354.1 ParD-like family protein [Pokkaliibacter sp. MBI-7]PPC75330.1 hypothetical protein C4K68_22130 [Pokkaliibacter plantistimulans]